MKLKIERDWPASWSLIVILSCQQSETKESHAHIPSSPHAGFFVLRVPAHRHFEDWSAMHARVSHVNPSFLTDNKAESFGSAKWTLSQISVVFSTTVFSISHYTNAEGSKPLAKWTFPQLMKNALHCGTVVTLLIEGKLLLWVEQFVYKFCKQI